MSVLLLIDDNASMRDRMASNLAGEGFSLVVASSAIGALDRLRERSIDAIVLQVVLPIVDGISLIPLIRRISQAPIIMVSEKRDLATRISAFAAGADDILTQPVDLGELVARINAALRRPVMRHESVIGYADLSIDVATRDVRRSTHHIATTPREFELLLVLVREPERVFTRTQLIELVWPTHADVQPGSVETLVSELRAKLDRPPLPRLIQTIRGVGYALRLAESSARMSEREH